MMIFRHTIFLEVEKSSAFCSLVYKYLYINLELYNYNYIPQEYNF